MRFQISKKETIYLWIFFLLFLLILVTPYLANEHIFTSLDNNLAEAIVLFLLLIVSYVIFRFYRSELENSYKNSNELLNYIGNINVQIQQMRSVFKDINRYPENKNDLKYVLKIMADRILGAINADWILLRIIESKSSKTLSEHAQARGKMLIVKHEFSNKDLLADKLDKNHAIIKTNLDNFDIKTCCVLSRNNLDENQKILVGRMVNDLEMLYLIYSSVYYMDSSKKNKT